MAQAMTCPHCDWSANLKAIKRAAFGLCPRCDEKSDRHAYGSGSKATPVLVRNPLVCSRCLHDWLRRNVTGRVLGRCYRMDEAHVFGNGPFIYGTFIGFKRGDDGV